MDFGLKGRHAVVSGGTRGIGRAVVRALLDEGAAVTACYGRDEEAAAELREELAGRQATARLVRADVSKEADAARLLAAAHEAYGPVDVLVNNAGIITHLPLADLPSAEWDRVVETNLRGTYQLTRAALARFNSPAAVVNVTSAVAKHGMPNAAHYVASKAGIIGLTRALCKELGPRGVRVNALACGIVLGTGQANPRGAAGEERYAAMTALGRLGRPEEIADAVLFLAGDAARYVTGAVLDVDGGI